MHKRITVLLLLLSLVILLPACSNQRADASTPAIAGAVDVPAAPGVRPSTKTPRQTKPPVSSPTTLPSATIKPSNTAVQSTATLSTTPTVGTTTPAPLQDFVAFIWNNLGMHCFQNDYSQFLILPPYNVFYAQVIQRGHEPHVVTTGLSASYSVPSETDPAAHTNFWQYASAYGWNLQPGIGLTGKGISGSMDQSVDHFIAEGVPVLDINDSGAKDPYPFFIVNVKNASNTTVAKSQNVAPASTEMSCYLCHAPDNPPDAFASILQSHDTLSGTNLVQQVRNGNPVMCNTCHADPVLGVPDNHGAQHSLSGAMHTFHADKFTGGNLPDNNCYACHPGIQTLCLRDVMYSNGINCQDCHGSMIDVGSASRTPWVNLPTCTSCHTNALTKATTKHIDNPNQHLTASTADLYQNMKGHGNNSVYCSACHGSPHAIYPTTTDRDNQFSINLQGHAGTIDDCSVCHIDQPNEPFFHFDD